jgi:two-component system response regulator FlrC
MNVNGNNILWTAHDLPMPGEIWKYLEGRGLKVVISDAECDIKERIQTLSPRLWVEQARDDSGFTIDRVREIIKEYPNLPVVLVSARSNVEDAVAAIKSGVYDYLGMNVSAEKLMAVIENALRGNIIVAPSVSASRIVSKENSLIASHPLMLKLLEMAKRIAPSRSTVLIRGETGVGKEVMARFIHSNSDRKNGPFIAVNCAALPETLLESELFGHEKGAFTGAVARKKGKFELASGGTLLLDEISEMAVSVQAKLLRVLQEREIDRIGGQATIPVDTRVIATTNRDLEAETKNGNFRLDLFYRLNVVPLKIPSLEQRQDDMGPLAEFFLAKHCSLNNIPLKKIGRDAIDYLKKRSWPGNVREFENLMERATLLVDREKIAAEDLEYVFALVDGPAEGGSFDAPLLPIKEMEKNMIIKALDSHNGNRTHAAKILGISVRTLRNKLHEYEVELNEEEEPQGTSA